MNGDTPSNSEERSDFCASKAIGTVADLRVQAYENLVRERLLAKYPTPTPAEARRLEKQIEKLVQIYAQGKILLQGRSVGQTPPRSRTARNAFHPRD
jgi:hypothetical protein